MGHWTATVRNPDVTGTGISLACRLIFSKVSRFIFKYAAIATCDVLRAIKNYDNATLNRSCRVVGTPPDVAAQPL